MAKTKKLTKQKNKIESYVFDDFTQHALFKLSSNHVIDSIEYPISSGKESITFFGHLKDTPLVAKIYKIETSKFKNMDKYINGDYRFKNCPKDKKDIVLLWVDKEFKNLTLASNNQVSCPIPIAKEKNILIMSFIGTPDGVSFPKLTETPFDFDSVYDQIIENYAKMLYGAKIVHADFSPFNILINPETQKITIIDFGQAVTEKHPNAKNFLKRDIISITDFLNKKFKNKNLSYSKVLDDIKTRKLDIYGRNN
ncbi:MAG TPA: RIO1 family regulatory kinase/ATPase [archaeon]|nr:RIO1 family regulatory kinase/ATPase [archaeon]